jgi:hypothetical protein
MSTVRYCGNYDNSGDHDQMIVALGRVLVGRAALQRFSFYAYCTTDMRWAEVIHNKAMCTRSLVQPEYVYTVR